MMRTCSLTVLLLSLSIASTFAGGGIFDDFAIIRVNSSDEYYDLGATTGNPNFQGATLFTGPNTTTLEIGGQTKTFKNNGTDVLGAAIFYRIYEVSSTPPSSFSTLDYAFQLNLPNPPFNTNDQQWGTDAAGANTTAFYNTIDISMFSPGNYRLEVYTRITTNGTDAATEIFSNSGGANFIADFVIEAAMPVQLASFSAIRDRELTHLDASFYNEGQLAEVWVERSHSVDSWAVIHRLQEEFLVNEKFHLQFTDDQKFVGRAYYRLRFLSHAGEEKFSPIKSVLAASATSKRLHNTLVSHELMIDHGSNGGESHMTIIHSNGQIVMQQRVTNNTQGIETLPISDWPSGTYLLIYQKDGLESVEKFVKQ